MTHSDLRERVARAMAIVMGRNPDQEVGEDLGDGNYNTWPVWAEHLPLADAAIALVLEEAAKVAECAPYNKGGMVCGCSEGLGNWTAAAIRALKEKPSPGRA
jgi:hypothetical protein